MPEKKPLITLLIQVFDADDNEPDTVTALHFSDEENVYPIHFAMLLAELELQKQKVLAPSKAPGRMVANDARIFHI